MIILKMFWFKAKIKNIEYSFFQNIIRNTRRSKTLYYKHKNIKKKTKKTTSELRNFFKMTFFSRKFTN